MEEQQRACLVAEVLAANARFYQAFRDADFAAMQHVWAHAAEVACLHPGTPQLVGRRDVLESFRKILLVARDWEMTCRHPRVFVLSEQSAFVTCLEANGDQPAHIIATNIFVREGDAWLMVQHQAGPLSRPVDVEPAHSVLN